MPGAGMIGCSLRDRGAEILGQRRGLGGYVDAGSTMGIPLLYPWANRLSRDRLEVAGRRVDLGQPGLRLGRDENGMAMHGLLTAATGWRVAEHRSTDDGGVLAAAVRLLRGRGPGGRLPVPAPGPLRAATLRGARWRSRSPSSPRATSRYRSRSASTRISACPAPRAPTGGSRLPSSAASPSTSASCRPASASPPRSRRDLSATGPSTTPSRRRRTARRSRSRARAGESSSPSSRATRTPRSTRPPAIR